jgi:hypothetical protein
MLMAPELLSKLSDVTVIGALVAAVLGGAALVWQTLYQRSKATRTVRDALFAELGHIESHYTITASEIVSEKSQRPVPLRLAWAKYGRVLAAEHIKEYATLGAAEMEALLQLTFMIRNTDLLLENMSRTDTLVESHDVEYLVERMRASAFNARAIMEHMAKKESRYEPLLRVVAKTIQGYI